MAGAWRQHLPLLRTMLTLLGLLALACWGLSAFSRYDEAQSLDDRRWQWRAAASFARAAPPQDGWVPFRSQADMHNRSEQYWLRAPLPAEDWRSPHLWIFGAAAVRVYVGTDLIYSYDPSDYNHRLNLYFHWNLVELPKPLPAEVTLLVDNRGALRAPPAVKLVDKGDLYQHLIRRDIPGFVLGGLFLFCALSVFGLYFARKDTLYIYFSLMALSGAYACLVRNRLLQVFWDQPWLGYLENANFPFGIFAFVSSLYVVFHPLHSRLLNALRWFYLGYALLTLLVALFLDVSWYGWLLTYPSLPLFVTTAGIIFWTIGKAYSRKKDPASVWMMTGLFIVAIAASVHVALYYLPSAVGRFGSWLQSLRALPFDLLSLGLFLFLICLIRLIVYRFGRMNRLLGEFKRRLEDSVSRRTAELEERSLQLQESNGRLAASLRENAEVMAEAMVLEERHRVTGTIHDSVGHLLTATIVQLEAARRLILREPDQAGEKIDAAQRLIRQGLEEIRVSVRLLREDASHYDLYASIGALLRETEDAHGVVVDRSLAPLPPSLSILQKKVLFQALQEGLANGIRHGGSRRFRLRLTADDRRVALELANDGETCKPAAEYGFGLRTIADRARQLGGRLTLVPGLPGCKLTVELPLESPAPHQRIG